MKKTLLLFGATALIAVNLTTFTSCKKEPEAPKNYYGVQQEDSSGAAQEAYVTLFCSLVVLAVVGAWLIKKLKGKR